MNRRGGGLPGDFSKDVLKVTKTHRAVLDSLQTLLENRHFGWLTVNELYLPPAMGRQSKLK